MYSGFFADGGSVAQGEFLKAASALRESYRFAHTNVEDLLKKHGVEGEYVAFFCLYVAFFQLLLVHTSNCFMHVAGMLFCSGHLISATNLKTPMWSSQRTNSQAQRLRSSFRTTCTFHLITVLIFVKSAFCLLFVCLVNDLVVKYVILKAFFFFSPPLSPYASFGICPHMTDDNKDQLKGKDLLVAYYDVDYEKNPKGSNYWRNR